jgi:uncharacterized protein YceH (UPF0502 family)/SAM-dependent methyltransferase
VELDPHEQRILGSLLEKERTVPATYPLTLNALRSACNQSSGREPVLSLGDHDVLAAIDRLKAQGLARIVHAGTGARATKYRQVLDEALSLSDAERAVVTLLLLRGAQTPGELRSRSDRLHEFASTHEVEDALATLGGRAEAVVRELPRRPGQRETRWIHLLGTVADAAAEVAAAAPPAPAGTEGALASGGAGARDSRVIAAYDAVADDYADRFLDELDQKPFDAWLLDRLSAEAIPGPVADAGCGSGHIGARLAAAGRDVTGFDLSPGMVAEARRRFPGLSFEVGDLRAPPAPSSGDGWSLVVAWYSLVHLAGSELPGALAALAGALRRRGTLALAVHLGAELVHRDEWFDHAVDVDFTLHDQAELLQAVRDAGLEDVEWYVRSPRGPEAETVRCYVVARKPA